MKKRNNPLRSSVIKKFINNEKVDASIIDNDGNHINYHPQYFLRFLMNYSKSELNIDYEIIYQMCLKSEWNISSYDSSNGLNVNAIIISDKNEKRRNSFDRDLQILFIQELFENLQKELDIIIELKNLEALKIKKGFFENDGMIYIKLKNCLKNIIDKIKDYFSLKKSDQVFDNLKKQNQKEI